VLSVRLVYGQVVLHLQERLDTVLQLGQYMILGLEKVGLVKRFMIGRIANQRLNRYRFRFPFQCQIQEIVIVVEKSGGMHMLAVSYYYVCRALLKDKLAAILIFMIVQEDLFLRSVVGIQYHGD